MYICGANLQSNYDKASEGKLTEAGDITKTLEGFEDMDIESSRANRHHSRGMSEPELVPDGKEENEEAAEPEIN